MGETKVSICCLVYNHEKYLRQCLEGIVNQKCDFKYELLIHDDASTDNSAKIIREYEEKYPDIIKPIYQTENQHSQNIKISKTYQYPRAKGEYYAWCEGDDYWIDETKLQKQVEFLEKNKEYSACVHSAICDNKQTGKQHVFPKISEERDYSFEDIVMGGGNIFATNSFMCRKNVVLEKPSCFDAKGFGDYQLFMFSALCGKVRCLSTVMSVYNYATSGSWSERIWSDSKKRILHHQEKIRMFAEIDKYYNNLYHDVINKKTTEIEYDILLLQKNKKEAKSSKYREIRKRYRLIKFKQFVKKLIPFI